MRLIRNLISLFTIFISVFAVKAVDPNFHIYICLGQSNMEGNAQIESVDSVDVPERFKVMATVDFPNSGRKKGEWYQAIPPLVRQGTGLTPMDYFGRMMVKNLPDEVAIGVVCVAIGGCKIEHLDKDFDSASLENEAEWFKGYMKEYDNAPYATLVECARKAQTQGVIKGILLHQGESNSGDVQWCKKVHKIYDNLLDDLGLESNSVPLIVGEVVSTEEGGLCGGMNEIIDSLSVEIGNARVVSSANLPQKGDGLHFTAKAYRMLGIRYAQEMLVTMGIENPVMIYLE